MNSLSYKLFEDQGYTFRVGFFPLSSAVFAHLILNKSYCNT